MISVRDEIRNILDEEEESAVDVPSAAARDKAAEDDLALDYIRGVMDREKSPGPVEKFTSVAKQAGVRALSSLAKSSGAAAIRAPKATAIEAAQGEAFDDYMAHIEAAGEEESKRLSQPEALPWDRQPPLPSAAVGPRSLTLEAATGRKTPYEIARAEAHKRSMEWTARTFDNFPEALKPEGLPDDPKEWPITPMDVAEEGWAAGIKGGRKKLADARQKNAEIASNIESWTPEQVKYAAAYAEATDNGHVGNAIIDFTSNWPNLAAAAAGHQINTVAPGLGITSTYGFMAAQEEGDFMNLAEVAGVPAEFAVQYAQDYAAVAGFVEYSQQILNVAGLFGKSRQKAAKTFLRRRGQTIIRAGKHIGIEGLEELTQQAVQYKTLSRMLKDYSVETGVSVEGLTGGSEDLPIRDDGSVDWRKATEALIEAAISGANVAAVSQVLGGARSTVTSIPGAARRQTLKYIQKRLITSTEGLTTWSEANPLRAEKLAYNKNPTRTEYEQSGLPRTSGQKERSRITADLREIMGIAEGATLPPRPTQEEGDLIREEADKKRTPVESKEQEATRRAANLKEITEAGVVGDVERRRHRQRQGQRARITGEGGAATEARGRSVPALSEVAADTELPILTKDERDDAEEGAERRTKLRVGDIADDRDNVRMHIVASVSGREATEDELPLTTTARKHGKRKSHKEHYVVVKVRDDDSIEVVSFDALPESELTDAEREVDRKGAEKKKALLDELKGEEIPSPTSGLVVTDEMNPEESAAALNTLRVGQVIELDDGKGLHRGVVRSVGSREGITMVIMSEGGQTSGQGYTHDTINRLRVLEGAESQAVVDEQAEIEARDVAHKEQVKEAIKAGEIVFDEDGVRIVQTPEGPSPTSETDQAQEDAEEAANEAANRAAEEEADEGDVDTPPDERVMDIGQDDVMDISVEPETFEGKARAIILDTGDAASKNRSMRKLAEEEGVTEKELQERVESVLVDVAREIVEDESIGDRETFNKLVDLYESQPLFSKRSSTSIEEQAYSTPLPLAFAAAMMADINPETGLYEPTGGHGVLAITADKDNVSINEINKGRAKSLERQGYADITENDATEWAPPPKSVHRVAANPPFGALKNEKNIDGYRIKRKDHLIAIKALDVMKDDGKAVLIVGAKLLKGRTGRAEKIFLNYLMNKYNVVGNFEVSGDLYRKQGASFPVRVIVIHGRKADGSKAEKLAPEETKRLTSWDEVYDAIKEVSDASSSRRQSVESDGEPTVSDTDTGGVSTADDDGSDDRASGGDGGPTDSTGGGGSGSGVRGGGTTGPTRPDTDKPTGPRSDVEEPEPSESDDASVTDDVDAGGVQRGGREGSGDGRSGTDGGTRGDGSGGLDADDSKLTTPEELTDDDIDALIDAAEEDAGVSKPTTPEELTDAEVDALVTAAEEAPKKGRKKRATSLAERWAKRDAEYAAAVESGDVPTQQRLVYEAAKAAGLTRLMHWSNRRLSLDMDRKDGTHFTNDYYYMTRMGLTGPIRTDMYVPTGDLKRVDDVESNKRVGLAAAVSEGYDGVTDGTDFLIAQPSLSKIKSADPILRDKQGNLIPLSERFGAVTKKAGVKPKRTPKVGKKGVKKKEDRAVKEIANSFAKHGVSGMESVAKGLFEALGSGGRLGMAGLTFDEDSYAKAKPHFDKAWREFKAAGKDFKDFIAAILELREVFGDVRPYIKRFRDDLATEAKEAAELLEKRRKDKNQTSEWKRVNDRQDSYGGQSKSPKIGTLINKFLSIKTQRALKRLVNDVGDIDEYVASKLEYASIDEMHQGLAGEQIDGIALAIYQIDKGEALIFGDQTGIGKGRQAAGIIRYAQKRGWTPVFMSADPKLFTDIYGDLADIGSTAKPLLMGDRNKASIRDEDGKVVLVDSRKPEQQQADMRSIVAGDTTLEELGFDSVFLTYSQIGNLEKDGSPKIQQQLLNHLVSGESKALIVMDESHRGSGETSITGTYLRGGQLDRKIKKAEGVEEVTIEVPGLLQQEGVAGVAYLSATYAKRPDSMPLYFKTSLGKAVNDLSRLANVFSRGGIAMQQAVAEALAEAGQMIRRESDFAGVKFTTRNLLSEKKDEAAKEKLIKSMDSVSEVLREIVQYSREAIDKIKDSGDDFRATTNTEQALSTSPFTSVLHNYIAQMLLAAKVNATADAAIAAHKRGEKVVIALSNTMGSFIKDYAETHGIKSGDPIDINYGDVLVRALDATMTVTEDDGKGNKIHSRLTAADLDLQAEYDVIMELINELDTSALPASPIDSMMKRMQDAGMTTDEITGRTERIVYGDDGSATFIKRSEEDRKDKNAHVKKFNREETDVLIVNEAGATGISLHASKKNRKYNPSPRHMIVAQADRNIDTFSQMLGRILRTGIIGDPKDFAEYSLMNLPLEAERRPNAVLSRKMTGLNAATTADTDSDVNIEALDFLNKYGDKVAAEILVEDPELQEDVSITVELDDEGEISGGVPSGLAEKLTGRMAILDNSRQAEIYEMMNQRYTDLVEEEKDNGTYDLEIDVQHSWSARLMKSTELAKGTDQSSMFTKKVVLGVYSIIDPRRPPTVNDLRNELNKHHGSPDQQESTDNARRSLAEKRKQLEEDFAEWSKPPELAEDTDQKLKDAVEKSAKARAELGKAAKEKTDAELDRIDALIGKRVEVTLPDTATGEEGATVTQTGFITNVKDTSSARGNPFAASLFVVEVMVESRNRKLRVPVSKLVRGTAILKKSTEGSDAIEDFAKDVDRSERVLVKVMTGNLVQAMEIVDAGQITSFATEDGSIETGLLLPESFNADKIARDKDPRFKLKSGKAVAKYLASGGNKRASSEDGVVVIGKATGFNEWNVSVPLASKRGADKIGQDKGVRKIIGDLYSMGKRMAKRVPEESQIVELVDYLINEKGYEFTARGATMEEVAKANDEKFVEDVSILDELDADSDTVGSPRAASTEGRSPRLRPGEAKPIKDTKLLQGVDVIRAIKRMWPKLSIRGKGTSKKRSYSGWYSRALREMRLVDARDIDTALHELGHHFDQEMERWSGSKNVTSAVKTELINLGKALYGSRRPVGGYKSEGFAEFIKGYITGDSMHLITPELHKWFTTEYLPANRDEARKISELENMVLSLRLQTPEQQVRAFRMPFKRDWSRGRIAARVAALEEKHRDRNLPMLRALQAAGITGLRPSEDPYILMTAFSRSAGGRALYSVLTQTVDLWGNKTGQGLRDAMEPVSVLGEETIDLFIDYAVARRAQVYHKKTRQNPKGMVSGIKPEVADEFVRNHQSELFDKTLDAVTEWSRRQLHLLVDGGVLTQEEFDKIGDLNPIYVPFSRQFDYDESGSKSKGKTGKGVYRRRGAGQEIHNPLDALVMQSEAMVTAAMQGAALRALVRVYDKTIRSGTSSALGKLMSEEPAPNVATTFSIDQIKREVAEKALELGADPAKVAEAMRDTWKDHLTVFTKGTSYKGREPIVSIVVDGKRRFFNVAPELQDMLEKNNQDKILQGDLGKLSRSIVGLQRLGATGLNPGFGILRNPIRDTLTAMLTAEYHWHVPMWSTLHGMLNDLRQTEDAKLYHSLGIDLAGRVGQDIRVAKKVGRRVTATTKLQKASSAGFISGIREILSHSEVGPRLMEFSGAKSYAKKQSGWTEADANILASVAAKDVTVNFSRAGSTGAAVNEVVLFYNAGIQSVDKILRSLGVFEAAPWAKEKHKGKNLLRTAAKGAGMLGAAAIAAYLRNRDEEWWKDLPPHEKWGYIHIAGFDASKGAIARIPLPFEAGALFGSLPVAAMESWRKGNLDDWNEALKLMVVNMLPITVELGSGSHAMLHSATRNISAVAPIADVLANRDWKGDHLVNPNTLRWRLPEDQFGPDVTGIARFLGEHSGMSPAHVDHLINGFTGGLFRRVARMLDNSEATIKHLVMGSSSPATSISDATGISLSDPSSIPVAGTLFLRGGTSRVRSDFYDGLELLRQKKGSGVATLSEIGELSSGDRLVRKLQKRWDERRTAFATMPKGQAKVVASEILDDVTAQIKLHQKLDFRHLGAMSVIYAATSPKADEDDIALAKRLMSGMTRKEVREALRSSVRRRGGRTRTRSSSYKPTSYGRRVGRLKRIGL